MKKLTISISFIFLCAILFAQADPLLIKSNSKGFYTEHKTAAKENFYSIGRLYHTHPKLIAAFNGLDMSKGLSLGQSLNIPLTDTNFRQNVFEGVPVYYNVTEKESLANISVKSKAQIENLRAWNDIKVDNVSAGTKLIVGFLITNEMQNRVVKITPKTTVVEESVSNVKKQESSEKKETLPEIKKDVIVEESVSNVKKAEEQKKQMEPEIKRETPPEVKEEKKTAPVVVKHPETKNDDGSGYFKSIFYQQVKTSPLTKEQTLTSSIFKTTSGWQDGKYYLLINGVEPGTIVKITNPSNSKTVFAKVLYAMDKIRENQGVDVRISDAAAASLAVSETDKFILKVNY